MQSVVSSWTRLILGESREPIVSEIEEYESLSSLRAQRPRYSFVMIELIVPRGLHALARSFRVAIKEFSETAWPEITGHLM